MHVESTADTSTSNTVIQPTTYTISSQQSTDFEMIDESALPILTKGTEEPMIARDNLNLSKETVHQRDDIIKLIVSHEETLAVAMVVDNKTDQTTEELSTPERPLAPYLRNSFPLPIPKTRAKDCVIKNSSIAIGIPSR